MWPGADPVQPDEFRRLLEERERGFSLELSETVVDRLARYLTELDIWRRRMSLTGRLSAEELALHALESVFGQMLVPASSRLVDIGSGAGFPGIPLALARPDLSVTTVEPRRKRAQFLRHVVRKLAIVNIAVQEARAAQLQREGFDVATSRAVTDLAEVMGQAQFLGRSGALLAWTTEPEKLADKLAPVFRLQTFEHVPGSRARVIARFRKSPVQLSPTKQDEYSGQLN